jgi:hypothetical protein
MAETPLHAIRIDAALWQAAKDKAALEQRTVSDVLRDYLEGWVRRPPRRR